MGGSSSSRRRRTPIPSYAPSGGSPGIVRPGVSTVGVTPLNTGVGVGPLNTGFGGTAGVNRDQQRELMQANQTIANLNNQLNAMRGGGMGLQQMPYSGYPFPGAVGQSPMPYNMPPMFNQSPQYAPPSPILQHAGGQSPYSYQRQGLLGGGGYRDTDYAAVANIAGLNPTDVAFLHREFMNLSRGGTQKIDRSVVRHLLRDVLFEVNNEHIDRAIESIFVTIDRNHDGFIDFPEFVGAFKDVLKGTTDSSNQFNEHAFPDVLTEQLRASGVGSGIASQPIAYVQQPQVVPQVVSNGGLSIVPLASTGFIQQSPFVFSGANHMQFSNASPPLLSFDQSQASFVIATPGQYMITQPTALQCVPLPMM